MSDFTDEQSKLLYKDNEYQHSQHQQNQQGQSQASQLIGMTPELALDTAGNLRDLRMRRYEDLRPSAIGRSFTPAF